MGKTWDWRWEAECKRAIEDKKQTRLDRDFKFNNPLRRGRSK